MDEFILRKKDVETIRCALWFCSTCVYLDRDERLKARKVFDKILSYEVRK